MSRELAPLVLSFMRYRADCTTQHRTKEKKNN
jgi:hypothetical protein